jgi:hypothetical protein
MRPDELPDDPLQDVLMPAMYVFEIEFRTLVVATHELSLEGIKRAEEQEVADITDDDERSYQRRYFEDLRIIANNLAVVTIVTRLDHWVTAFCNMLKLQPIKSGKVESLIISKMEALNARLGKGPIELPFFADLVNARDSVIHGDSQSEWNFGGRARSVASEHMDGYKLSISEEQVAEAVKNALLQLAWYQDEMQNR